MSSLSSGSTCKEIIRSPPIRHKITVPNNSKLREISYLCTENNTIAHLSLHIHKLLEFLQTYKFIFTRR